MKDASFGLALALLSHSQGLKGLTDKNALAYYKLFKIAAVKSFIALSHRVEQVNYDNQPRNIKAYRT